MPFNKVLILSASAGAGHMRAADAVERAFRLTNAAAEVRHVDTLQYTNKLFRPLGKVLREYRPDITVCPHFLPAEIISWLKAKQRVRFRQAIVVTDFDVHAMWLCHHYEQYFVALDETREHLVRLGIPE